MRRLAYVMAGLALALAGCTTVEGVPPEASDAPFDVPVANQAPFDFAAEMRVLTRACVASEIGGPAQLQQLLSQGYVLTNRYGGVSYARQAPGSGELFSGGPDSMSARDPNTQVDCDVQIQPYTRAEALLPVAEDEMTRLGYRRIEAPGPTGRVFTRFVGNGQRFGVFGSTSTSPTLSYGLIEFRLFDASDATCRTEGLAPDLREGCAAPQ